MDKDARTHTAFARQLVKNNCIFASTILFSQEDARLRALTLLRTLLVVGEDAAHRHIHTLVPALAK